MSQDLPPAVPARMADVARLAGVSKMTVSRVLKGGYVAETTRARVQRAIDALGYVADAAAGALSSGRSEFVAVLVPSLASSNFSDTVRGLTDAFMPHGLQLLLGATDYLLEREEDLARSMLRHAPRAVALTGRQHTQGTRALLARAGIPVVEMWDLPREPIDFAVGFSNQQAARAMVRHLHARGYRRIGFLAGQDDLDRRGLERLRGYLAEIKALGLGAPRVIRLGASPVTMSHGSPAVAALLDTYPDTDAAMCVSDMSAFGAIMECRRRGLRVPDDLAVAGFGNFEVSWCCEPPITTVSVDAYGIGRRTGEVLATALGLDGAAAEPARLTRVEFAVVPRRSA